MMDWIKGSIGGIMRVFLAVLLASVLGSGVAQAASRHGNQDHVAFGQTITIEDGETAGDIVCFFCTVRARGDVLGDLVTFFGNVEVADGKAVSGDMVVFGGGLKLGKESRLGGDLVLFGSDLQEDAGATIHGDRVVFAGSSWLLVLLLPLLIPIGLVWLVVRLLRGARYRFPAYPGGRF